MKKELITYKLKSFAKSHFYIFILLLLSLAFFSSILSSSKTLGNIHYVNDMTFQSENIRKFLFESNGFPLWTPYFYAGQPFIAIPEHYLFDLNFLYILLFRNIFLSMNLAVISYFFLAGLGMYFLAYEIVKKKNASFIASIIFMFNGLMHTFILNGHLNILESYALMPFVFLFAYKALNSGKWLLNSTIAAFFFSMMVYAGGVVFFLYTWLITGLYIAWSLIGKNFKKRLLRAIIVSAVIIFLLFGLSALKLLPVLEFTQMSSRAAGVNYQEFLGEPILLANLWSSLINASSDISFSGAIGIAPFILLLFGLLSLRKRMVIFCLSIIILSILLAAGTFAANLLYHLPGFGQMRHIERALVMFVFIAPIIVAYGFNNLVNILRKYNKNFREWLVFSAIVLVLTVELVLLQEFPVSAEVTRPLSIPILNEVSKDKSDFRVATYALSTPIGASGYNYYSQLGIPEIKGGGGIWVNDYVQYLAVAQQASPSKMYGILNGKYIISDRKLDDSGLTLKGTFEKCDECKIVEAYGPYLYENRNVVPRALVVDNAILLLGNGKNAMELSYSMIINNLNPLSSVLIRDKSSVADYKIEELKKFNALILLSNSVAQNDISSLQQYANNGGNLLPNILEGKNTIAQEDINNLFDNLAGPKTSKKELELRQKSVNEFYINLNGERGWLVLSEKFSHFPGWKATLNGKELKIYKANIVVSAVYLEGERGELAFEYNPSSFRTGKMITSITILILIAYLAYIVYSKIKRR
ncbi:hypothetical protein HYW19_01970 [Candidatus Woesearchaeota archaeon]|nr:hypothetical protein [Candidatus Woesearchaeota archaeon]